MKILQYSFYFAAATLLMASDCSNKDSEFYNDVFVTAPNVVNITSFDAAGGGTTVNVNTNNFSKDVEETGQTHTLDVYRTSGGAPSFSFSYLIEKQNANSEWELFPVMDAYAASGSIEAGDFVVGHAHYNNAGGSYDFNTDNTFSEPGNYRLSFGYNSLPSKTVLLRSDSINNNLFVNLYSPCDDLDANGFFYFTVE
ncbi:MAG TPA: hypothetical protein VK528_12210 [Flavobacterium sp.]|nr:hypothetical protein [Flavobacterium sp.]